ncbi:MAG TPA: glycosyltransferase family 4 protein [Propionibacteriaceae bacterium]|nr:glycosyltransferase family 4 protein [Propionibacteriaceae bacterium]
MVPGPVLQGISFYPRGGSAQVVRYLTAALLQAGWHPRIVAGSLGETGSPSHAATFFAGLPVSAADFTPAVDAWERGEDPLDQPVPLHASYEDKPGVPDRIFTAVSPKLAVRQVDSWRRLLAGLSPLDPLVLHLHHLTPLHDAAESVWPDVPVVTHLHGTELLMLEHIEQYSGAGGKGSPIGLSESWRHAEYWTERLRATAQRSNHILAVSTDHAVRAVRILGVPEDHVTVVPNGVDTERFRPLNLTARERLALLRRWLVDEPLGWDESGRPGSVRYSPADLSAFTDTTGLRPVLLYVGRFTAVKRLPLLLRAYARVRAQLGPVAPLLIWGGHPGEWEGEHPYSLVTKERIDGVFFVGWRGHEDLRLGLGCAEIMVAPSVGEAFGSVYLEAMCAGLPVVATRTGGPPTYLNRDARSPEGWLIPPDDEDALVDVLIAALTCPTERLARADAAQALVRRGYSWQAIADRVAGVYEAVQSPAVSGGRSLRRKR